VTSALSNKNTSAINGPVFARNFDFWIIEVFGRVFEYDVTKRAEGIVRNTKS
jgi:hypothetical protein